MSAIVLEKHDTVITRLDEPSSYKDNQFKGTDQEWMDLIKSSNTLYIGNLSFYTTEEQIYELFSKCGEIKRIIMGLDRLKKTPCGFCFVEYYTAEFAFNCMKYINGTKLDDRIIRTDLDPGFKEGRQFGRGKSGGQVRDEYRQEYDKDRGGWGHIRARFEEQRELSMAKYEPIEQIPSGANASINSRLGGSSVDTSNKKRGYDSSDSDENAKKRKSSQNETSSFFGNTKGSVNTNSSVYSDAGAENDTPMNRSDSHDYSSAVPPQNDQD